MHSVEIPQHVSKEGQSKAFYKYPQKHHTAPQTFTELLGHVSCKDKHKALILADHSEKDFTKFTTQDRNPKFSRTKANFSDKTNILVLDLEQTSSMENIKDHVPEDFTAAICHTPGEVKRLMHKVFGRNFNRYIISRSGSNIMKGAPKWHVYILLGKEYTFETIKKFVEHKFSRYSAIGYNSVGSRLAGNFALDISVYQPERLIYERVGNEAIYMGKNPDKDKGYQIRIKDDEVHEPFTLEPKTEMALYQEVDVRQAKAKGITVKEQTAQRKDLEQGVIPPNYLIMNYKGGYTPAKDCVKGSRDYICPGDEYDQNYNREKGKFVCNGNGTFYSFHYGRVFEIVDNDDIIYFDQFIGDTPESKKVQDFAGRKSCAMIAPPESGKTYFWKNRRCLICVPTRVQAIDYFGEKEGLTREIVMEALKEDPACGYFITHELVATYMMNDTDGAFKSFCEEYGVTIVVDEAHHLYQTKDPKNVYLRKAYEDGYHCVYMTGTIVTVLFGDTLPVFELLPRNRMIDIEVYRRVPKDVAKLKQLMFINNAAQCFRAAGESVIMSSKRKGHEGIYTMDGDTLTLLNRKTAATKAVQEGINIHFTGNPEDPCAVIIDIGYNSGMSMMDMIQALKRVRVDYHPNVRYIIIDRHGKLRGKVTKREVTGEKETKKWEAVQKAIEKYKPAKGFYEALAHGLSKYDVKHFIKDTKIRGAGIVEAIMENAKYFLPKGVEMQYIPIDEEDSIDPSEYFNMHKDDEVKEEEKQLTEEERNKYADEVKCIPFVDYDDNEAEFVIPMYKDEKGVLVRGIKTEIRRAEEFAKRMKEKNHTDLKAAKYVRMIPEILDTLVEGKKKIEGEKQTVYRFTQKTNDVFNRRGLRSLELEDRYRLVALNSGCGLGCTNEDLEKWCKNRRKRSKIYFLSKELYPFTVEVKTPAFKALLN